MDRNSQDSEKCASQNHNVYNVLSIDHEKEGEKKRANSRHQKKRMQLIKYELQLLFGLVVHLPTV